MKLVSAAEVQVAEREKKRRHPDHREPLQPKVHRRESGNSVPVDAILLSFFDGVGSAGLVFQQICQEKSWTGRMLLWETDRDLVKLTAERFPEAEHRGDVDADKACKIIERLEAIDPEHQATIIIAGGPPCHDYSRIRSAPPGTKGEEVGQRARVQLGLAAGSGGRRERRAAE